MDISLGGTPIIELQERWFSEIRRGRAFVAGGTVAASVGNFSEFQLFNEVGSGVILVLRIVRAVLIASGLIELRRFNTALATDDGAGINLLSGGAVAKAKIREATPAVRNGSFVLQEQNDALSMSVLSPDWFFELDAGEGIVVAPTTTNAAIRASWFWIELPV